MFLTESAKNKNLPIGGGLWSTALYHPEDVHESNQGHEATFADFSLLGRGPFGQKIRVRQEVGPAYGLISFAYNAYMQGHYHANAGMQSGVDETFSRDQYCNRGRIV